MDNAMTGDELKALRNDRRITQSELAKIAKLSSQVTIARYENGTRKIPESMALLFRLLLDDIDMPSKMGG